jgi:hypothetical protein
MWLVCHEVAALAYLSSHPFFFHHSDPSSLLLDISFCSEAAQANKFSIQLTMSRILVHYAITGPNGNCTPKIKPSLVLFRYWVLQPLLISKMC